MKKVEDVRYPNSAELFKFCKEALNIKHNNEVKVIDQHVGSILGYDPADCSHWKKGKKNIKSLSTLQTIANHLDIDSRFIADIVAGKADYSEALQEFKGFGAFTVSSKYVEDLKRDFFRNPVRFGLQTPDPKILEGLLETNRDTIVAKSFELVSQSQLSSCPVFLPEIISSLPNLSLKTLNVNEENKEKVELEKLADGTALITIPEGDMKPHLRVKIAREIGRFVLDAPGKNSEPSEILDAKLNLFAIHLLMPGVLFHQATNLVSPNRDLIQQLSEMFWVSRSIVGQRLKDFLQFGN